MQQNDRLDYDFARTVGAIRRFWWLVLIPPILIAAVLITRNLTTDYQSSFSASILLPGDTEIPGSAERPELMILDDLGPVVESDVFAAMVAAEASLPISDVEGTLNSERYSRIATITASSADADLALQIATAAGVVLPQAVNQFMIAVDAQQATVTIIDSPSDPVRGEANKWTVTLIATVVGLAIGLFAALILDAVLPVRQIEKQA